MTLEQIRRDLGSILLIVILVNSGLLASISLSIWSSPFVEGSTWTQNTDKDFENGTFTNTTITGTGKNARINLDIAELNRWNLKNPIGTPIRRYCAGMAAVYGTDKVVLYGGAYTSGSINYLNDTWIYDTRNNTWVQKHPGNSPSDRYGHIMASIWGHDKVLYYGGYPNYNDTWTYDLSANIWTEMRPKNNPGFKSFNAMASIWGTDKVLLFGGYPSSGETWIYDYSDNDWTIKTPSSKPSGRYGQSMAYVYNDDKVVLFGGILGGYALNDTWVYDLNTDTWTEHKPGIAPSPRYYAAMAPAYGTNRVILFGGMGPFVLYSDETWIYDVSAKRWEQKTLSIKPPGRYCHSIAAIYGTDKILLFGGSNGYQFSNFFNGTWIYKYFLNIKNGTYVSTPFDTGANSTFIRLTWNVSKPSNTSIKFQFKTAVDKQKLNKKEFLGPDGSTSSYYTSSPSNLWLGHYGDRWVQYKVYFNMSLTGVSPSLNEISVHYNCIPQLKVVGPSDGSISSENKPTFLWTFKDYDSKRQVAFQVLIDDEINFSDVNFDSSIQYNADERWIFPAGTGYTELPDGIWYWKVRTMDEGNFWTNYSEPRMLLIDTLPPDSGVTFPVNNGFYKKVDFITGIASCGDISSALEKVEISVKRLIDNYYWEGNSWILLPTWLPAEGTVNWTYDSTAVQWNSGVKYRVQSRATDIASNIEVPGLQNIFTIDTYSPESSIGHPNDNTWVNELKVITGTAVDIGGSGVGKVEICIKCTEDSTVWDEGAKKNEYWDGNDWSSSETWLAAFGTNEWSYNSSNIPFTTGDHYVIHSRAVDNTDNIELPGSGTNFMYDDSPPEPISIFINNGDKYTKSNLVKLSLTADDLGSGVAEMAFCTDGVSWSIWEPFNTTKSFNLASGDGEKTIYFKVKDLIGNIADPVRDEIFLDSTPPHGLSVVINEDAEYTGSKQIRLDFTATDLGSGVGEITYSFDGNNWVSWEAFKSTKFISLGVGDGERYIYYKARDKVGNTADLVSDSIILDTTPPFSLSIKINDGATETKSTTVALTLRALDNLSGVGKIAFSLDGETWSEWEDYTKLKPMELSSGNGIKNVYFKAKDNVGNEAEPVSATILMNITTPVSDTDITQTSSGIEFWIYLTILVIIIIALSIIIAVALLIRKKKRTEQELVPIGAVTIKPQPYMGSVSPIAQVPGTVQYPQLMGAPTVFISTTPAGVPAPVPVLAKTTQTSLPISAQGSAPQPQVVLGPLPQLPPANVQIQTQQPQVQQPQPIMEQPTITPPPTPVTTPTTTQTIGQTTPQPQPTVAPTPTIAQSQPEELEPVNGPAVHLPGTSGTTLTDKTESD